MTWSLAAAVYKQPWFSALLYLVIAVILARVVGYLLKRRDAAMQKLLGRTPDASERTRYVMIRRLVVAAILFVGVAVALLQFEEIKAVAQAMLASAAIFAAVIGIAARAPLANLVSGIMIAFSQPVRLNDYVAVAGLEGTIERITLTYTFIRTDDGRKVVIPNEIVISSAVENFSLGTPECMVTIAVTVPPETDLDACRGALQETLDGAAAAPAGQHNRVEVVGIGGDGVELRLHAWAADPRARAALADEVRVETLRRLVAEGVLPSAHERRDAG
jgi:small-conductance mechanosensitive channel